MSNFLLLISDKSEDKLFAEEVARGNGLSLRQTGDPSLGVEIINQDTPQVILVDGSSKEGYQEFENAIQNTVGLFSDRINANAIHFISSEDIEKTPYLVQSPLFGHFLTRNYGNPSEAGVQYGRVVRHVSAKRAFGLSGLLAPDTKIQVVRLQSSAQKSDAVEAVRNFAVAAKFQSRMATVIANAVDELLMNALYDAPIDDLGRPLFKATARNTVIKLVGKHAVEMHVGFDGKNIGVTVSDLFGSLDKNALLSFISKVYVEEEYRVRNSTTSAGLGLATVYRSGGSLFFASENRHRTEVTVLFRRTTSYREFKDQFRFLSTQFYF